MSRVASTPVDIPQGVDLGGRRIIKKVKGSNGKLELVVHSSVAVKQEEQQLLFSPADESRQASALAGTMRVLVNNMMIGVSQGFEKKLLLNGVGYRAKASGQTLNLTLGFSHPVDYVLPEGVSAETPTQTEIVVKGADKQKVGQAAAEIRAFRPPEPYKGKGVRYADEYVRRKETKKK